MAETAARRKFEYLSVWGDTVDFRHLFIGILVGAIISFICSYFAKSYIHAHSAGVPQSLIAGYGLLFGLGAAVLVAVAVGFVFKPKRIFSESDSCLDWELFARTYGFDAAQEREYLKSASPVIAREMETLGLLSVLDHGKS